MVEVEDNAHPLRPSGPPRQRAEDQIRYTAATLVYDYAADKGLDISFADTLKLCEKYHEALKTLGGSL
jgi:hypothetical protein